MRVRSSLLLLALASLPALADQVVDDFESGTNPNEWGWTNNGGGAFTIQPGGGNPGAWLDSGVPYFSDHPNLTAVPPAGSALRAALATGHLRSASIDVERLDTSAVNNCHPVYTDASTFSLSLIDIHSVPTDPPTVIEAHTTDGPVSPTQGPFAWTTASFAIPSDATATPPGWVLDAPPDIDYSWADLMRNVDGIRFFVVDPDEFTFDACWHLGADNVTVAYDSDALFEDGFDAEAP